MPDEFVPPSEQLDAMVEAAKRGPHVLEVQICVKCGHEFFVYHAFQETVGCGNCGHPHASCVSLYRSIREKAVDRR